MWINLHAFKSIVTADLMLLDQRCTAPLGLSIRIPQSHLDAMCKEVDWAVDSAIQYALIVTMGKMEMQVKVVLA